ncbi:MAG: GHMP kinase [Chitinophagaceae bacterium]|nr:GHMP kinase [Chitinophagaceae bacterium]
MSEFFLPGIPIFEASAPGRMDVMGGISDYSGSLLLQMPIRETTTVKVQRRSQNDRIHIKTKSSNVIDEFVISLDQLSTTDHLSFVNSISTQPGGDWAAYILGCIFVLARSKQLHFDGMNIFVESSVPVGKGVSSSAALEMATLCALSKMHGLKLSSTDLPLIAQQAENQIVGAPCGLMDQLTSHLGERNKLLPLICQPHDVFPSFSLPKSISFCGIDSGIRHAVSGASYSDVRAAAFMAYTIIATSTGISTDKLKPVKASGLWDQLPFKGYLSNIPQSLFESSYKYLLPDQISGAEFISQYQLSIDQTTSIIPDKIYRLRACAEHPIRENFRVQTFLMLLRQFSKSRDKNEVLKLLGELMYQSHAGYSSVGLGNDRTDELVEMVRSAGPERQVYGARVTGGGSGGTVCILCYGKDGKDTVRSIFNEYRKTNGIKSYFFTGSSDGAMLSNKLDTM